MSPQTRPMIAIDFDGVIHKYSKGWQNGEVYDDPIDGAFRAILDLYIDGYDIAIFTARDELEPVKKWFWKWYNKIFPNSEHIPIWITNIKPPAVLYIDDKAIEFKDWNETMNKIRVVTKGRNDNEIKD